MKKKFLSLITAALSLVATALYSVMTALLSVRLADGEKFIPEVTGDVWFVEVINRISKAGFNVFFTIMAIVLFVVLALYRIMMAYFHFKVFSGDEEFYRERIKDNVLYAFLSVVVLAVFSWVYSVGTNLLPPEIIPLVLVLIIIYALIATLPIMEIVIFVVVSKLKTEKVETVPTREDILEELNDLADITAAEMVGEMEDLEIESDEDLDNALIAEGLIDGDCVKTELKDGKDGVCECDDLNCEDGVNEDKDLNKDIIDSDDEK